MAFRTIHAVLSQPGPVIEIKQGPSVIKSGQKWTTPAASEVWTDFNLGNLLHAYGDVLGQPSELDVTLLPKISVRSTSSLKDLGTVYLAQLVAPMLEQGRAVLQPRLRGHSGCLEILRDDTMASVSGLPGGLRPTTSFCSGSDYLVFGAVRRFDVWSSSYPDGAYLFDQLLGYSIHGGTRYGFAHTETELVVTQACSIDGGHVIRYQSIPLAAHGTDQLTPGLALWCLAAMALNENHRNVANQADTLPINSWHEYMQPDGSVLYVHHLSRRVLSAPPPGAHIDPLNE